MNESLANTEEYKGFTIEIHFDNDGDSPRDLDNLGTMVCWHRRHDLGDKHDFAEPQDFLDWLDERRKERKQGKDGDAGAIVLPLYLYDHSGITMSTSREGQFRDPWDAGQVGWTYVTDEDIRKEYGVKRITRAIRETARKVLIGEVDTYDQFLTGQVYGYIIKDGEDDHIDSCWGFYDGEHEYNGMYALSQAKEAVDSMIEGGRAPVPMPEEEE